MDDVRGLEEDEEGIRLGSDKYEVEVDDGGDPVEGVHDFVF